MDYDIVKDVACNRQFNIDRLEKGAAYKIRDKYYMYFVAEIVIDWDQYLESEVLNWDENNKNYYFYDLKEQKIKIFVKDELEKEGFIKLKSKLYIWEDFNNVLFKSDAHNEFPF